MSEDIIVDAHVHLTPPEIIDNIEYYRRQEPYFDLLCGSSVNKNITGEQLIKEMDRTGVDRAVVFGFAFENMDLCIQVNNYIIKMIKKYPERLIGLAVVNPLDNKLIEELERCQKQGLQGVGELFPAGQEFDVTDSKHLKQLCNFCSLHNWPLMIHVNEQVGHDYCGKTDDSIEKAEQLAENFSEVTFIFSHLGGGLCFYELMPELRKKLSHVYYDTAAVPFLYSKEIYSTLKSMKIIDKILLGTDYPLISPARYLNDIDKSPLVPGEKEKIRGKNILRLIE